MSRLKVSDSFILKSEDKEFEGGSLVKTLLWHICAFNMQETLWCGLEIEVQRRNQPCSHCLDQGKLDVDD